MTKQTRKLGELSAKALADYTSANSWIWSQSIQRQQRVAPVADTKGALIIYSSSNALSYIPHLNKNMQPLLTLIEPCLKRTQATFGRGYWCKATLTVLPAGKQVKTHFDKGWPLTCTHRIHWVVTTNSGVHFKSDGTDYHFGANEIWEVDNRSVHSVTNAGDSDRVHLIADFLPEPDEQMHYWEPYVPGSLEDLFFQAVDRARERWGSANNPLY